MPDACNKANRAAVVDVLRLHGGGTAVAAPPPFRPGDPALCGSHPIVTPYLSGICCVLCSVICVFLQYFDTVGWVF